MQSKPDAQLMREYAEHGSEAAFSEIVSRYADLVYSAALRQTASPELARDVAQSVFSDLARKARLLAAKLAVGQSLVGWLYRGTRYEALTLLRDERRRQARERQVMQHFTPAGDASPDWDLVRPVLDEAMASLNDEDRDALLLRFFRNLDFRTVGAALGTSDDAAQKRVSRALERLRAHLTRRGVTTTAVALSTVLSANAVQIAPAGLAMSLASSALAGVSLPTAATLTVTKAIAMTTLQKTVITVVAAAAVGTGLYEAHEISRRQTRIETLEQQQTTMAGQIERLNREREEAAARATALQQENQQLRQTAAEVPSLRGELTRLQVLAGQRSQLKAAAQDPNDPFTQTVLALTVRAAELNQYLGQMPDKRIPELQFLTENDWLAAAREASLDSDADVRKALSKLRSLAKNTFGLQLCHALDQYLHANGSRLPDDPAQLKPFFKEPVDDSVLQRYKMLHTGYVTNLPPGTEWVISEKAPVDRDYDSHLYVGPHGRTSIWSTGLNETGDPDETWAARPQP